MSHYLRSCPRTSLLQLPGPCHAVALSVEHSLIPAASVALLGGTPLHPMEPWKCPRCGNYEAYSKEQAQQQHFVPGHEWIQEHQQHCTGSEATSGMSLSVWQKLERLERVAAAVAPLSPVVALLAKRPTTRLAMHRCLELLLHRVQRGCVGPVASPTDLKVLEDGEWKLRLLQQLQRAHKLCVRFENLDHRERALARSLSAKLKVTCTNGSDLDVIVVAMNRIMHLKIDHQASVKVIPEPHAPDASLNAVCVCCSVLAP